jgi:DNA-binding IclR family transcriptional regulator
MEIGSVGPTTVSRELTVALSTAHRDLAFLESEGLISSDSAGKRRLTPLGVSYVESLF